MPKSRTNSFETDKYLIEIDCSSCISCGTCAFIAPDIFELDKKNICQVKKDSNVKKNELVSAVNSCPVQAIKYSEK